MATGIINGPEIYKNVSSTQPSMLRIIANASNNFKAPIPCQRSGHEVGIAFGEKSNGFRGLAILTRDSVTNIQGDYFTYENGQHYYNPGTGANSVAMVIGFGFK